MEFPQIPTDNLYKFMALSGLALFIAFILIPGQKILDLERQTAQLSGEYEILQIELSEREDEFSLVREKIVALKDKIKMVPENSHLKKSESSEFLSELHAVENAHQSAHEKLVQTNIFRAKTKAKNKEMKVVADSIRVTNRALAFGALLGIFLMTFGFRLWHQRVQLLQDRLLKLQVETGAPNPPLNSDPTATVS